MAAGWIAKGPDQDVPQGADVQDPWKPVGPDVDAPQSITRPHQDPRASPVANTIGMYARSRDFLFGHDSTPDDPRYTTGAVPAVGDAIKSLWDAGSVDNLSRGPDVSTLAKAYPKVLGANLSNIPAGIEEAAGSRQVEDARKTLAALAVLPQVAARTSQKQGPSQLNGTMGGYNVAQLESTDSMAADPVVAKTARKLGMSPEDFAAEWSKYQGLTQEQQADLAAGAQKTLAAGTALVAKGTATRNQAWADAKAWAPSDLVNGGLDPWSAKGIAFNTALAIPQMAVVAGAAMAAGAAGGPGAGLAAGAATSALLFAPQQREDAKSAVENQANALLEKADAVDASAPVGKQRGLNPVSQQLRQQAADLAASSDHIANTAGFLYAAADAAGATPVAAVLTKNPVAKAVADRIVGATVAQTLGGRVAGTMVANGAGGMFQTAVQKAVDAGIVHEDQTLSDALKDIAYSGVVSAVTAAPFGVHGAREASGPDFADRARAAADTPAYRTPSALPAPDTIVGNSGTTAPNPGTNPGGGETPAGMQGNRQAYADKVDAVKDAASGAATRADVTLEPEEDGWSVHVQGQAAAHFDTVEAAREAMAQGRKVVGTRPVDTGGQESASVARGGATDAQNPAEVAQRGVETAQTADSGADNAPVKSEDALERTQPIADRRTNPALRTRVDDMTAEQMKAALLTHELTGIPNRRAYEDAPKKAVQVSVDSDGLKAINDFGTHAAGDQALKAVAAALHAEDADNTFHVSGDEFLAQADDEDGAHDLMTRVNNRLANAVVEVTMPDGKVFHLKGLGVSYGVGKDLNEADSNLGASKEQRQAEGLRAPRGELPAQASIRAPEAGGARHGGQVAGEPGAAKNLAGVGNAGQHVEVLGQRIKRPLPISMMRAGGEYPTVHWNGLPIRVENAKGQRRSYVDEKGQRQVRVMRDDYGYVDHTRGADGEGVDIMMGAHPEAPHAYVIDQLDHSGKSFDEHKIQVGVRSADEARQQYLRNYQEGWRGLGGITELSAPQLKAWLKSGDMAKPINPESVPRATAQRGAGPDPRHDSLLQFLARHPRGLDSEEARTQGIDSADMALSTAHVGIKRSFRRGGLSFDHAAEALHEAGYPVADERGHANPNTLLDKIDAELRGEKVYSGQNQERLPEHAYAKDWAKPLSDADLAKLSLDETRERIEKLRAEESRLERELERHGIQHEPAGAEDDDLERIPFAKGDKQGDLFGDHVAVKNELKRLEAALDRKRNSGQESVETGRADDLFSASRGQDELAFRRAFETGKGMQVGDVRAAVKRMIDGFAVKPDVTVVDTLKDLEDHPEVGHIVRSGQAKPETIAFVHPRTNKIYMIADQLHSPEHAASALAHEFITHFGLRAAFGDRRAPQYRAILDGVAKAMPAELRTRGEQEYGDAYRATNAAHRMIAAEEVLAYYGQRYASRQDIPARMQRFVDRVRAMLRDWIRSALRLPQKFDELFVKRTLADLEQYLRRGRRAGPEGASTGVETERPAAAEPQDTFYSGLARAVDAARRDKGTGAEWEATLKNMPGVKAEELQWTGLKDWLDGRGRVSKAEVADYIAAHRVQLGEVVKAHAYDEANLSAREQTLADLRDMGFHVEEGDTGDPVLTRIADGREVANEDIPAVARDLVERLRAPAGWDAVEASPVSGPKFSEYVTPGGKNYREMLLTLPHRDIPPATKSMAAMDGEERAAHLARNAGTFHNSHWDEQNVLAHVRFDDRTGAAGERVLHMAEVQSDWHQQGRRFGYTGDESRKADIKQRVDTAARHRAQTMMELTAAARAQGADPANYHAMVNNDNGVADWELHRRSQGIPDGLIETMRAVHAAARRHVDALNEYSDNERSVPYAPFKTTWPELAVKRMLRYAAEHGYDALSWDTGSTNADRYNLAKRIQSVRLHDNFGDNRAPPRLEGPFEKGLLLAHDHSGATVIEKYLHGEKELVDAIGKETAERLLGTTPTVEQLNGLPGRVRQLRDQQLEIGGEGMKSFYDKMLPATVGKLVKKWGSSVRADKLVGPTGSRYDTVRWGNDGEMARVIDLNANVDNHFVGGEMTPAEAEAFAAAKNGAEGLPVHRVDITPAMRDSVLEGQPMFLKRQKKPVYETNKGDKPYGVRRAYDLARRGVAAIPASELNLSFRRILDPAGVSDIAGSTALRMRANLGELAQQREQAVQSLEGYAKQFELLSTADRMAFIDSMETGSKQGNRDLQPAADAIRKLLDDERERIRDLGVGALDNFIENYFPHIWADEKGAKAWLGKVFGRRPLKGPASFLKERTIPTTAEGLAAGLTPISTNPLVLATAKLGEMQKFHAGVKLMQSFKDEKLAVFKPAHKKMPEGWVKIDDAVGTVRQWSEVEQGFIERGHYIMPADAGRLINNHLGASALRNFLPAQLIRVVSNAVNALQLGFSAFHLGFTTLDAIVSKVAVGVERLAHGEPLRAAAAFLEAATGPGAAIVNVRRGYALRNAYANPKASPELGALAHAVALAGGRIKMDRLFMASQGQSPFHGVGVFSFAQDVKAALQGKPGALKAIGSFPRDYAIAQAHNLKQIVSEAPFPRALTVPIEIAGRMTRASTAVIMEHIVPLQKLGVFADLAADHMRRNPLEDEVSKAAAMQKIWDSVDNRLGEMVYDNVFWNRTFKDVNHMSVRAVGWNLGTVRELGGAPIDVVKLMDYVARGAPAEDPHAGLAGAAERLKYQEAKSVLERVADKMGHKIAYTIALVAVTMVTSAIMQKVMSGQGPTELKDYFFPATGRMTKYGTKERMSLPSYMKDIYEYSTQPATTVINKANPVFGIIHSIYANEDFFGNAIRDPDASNWAQAWDAAKYAKSESLPFSWQGGKQFAGAGTDTFGEKAMTVAPYFGLTPAPARVTSPEQMDAYQLRETEKAYLRGLNYKLKQAVAAKDDKAAAELRAQIVAHKLSEHGTEHTIREGVQRGKEASRDAADKISSLIRGKSREDAASALAAAGMPAFAALWRSLPDTPRPRVVAQLEAFA